MENMEVSSKIGIETWECGPEHKGRYVANLGHVLSHEDQVFNDQGKILFAIPMYECGGDNYELACDIIENLKIRVGIGHIEKWELLRYTSGGKRKVPAYCKVWGDYWLLVFESKRDAVRFRLKYPDNDLEPFKQHGIINRASLRHRVQNAGRARRGLIYSEGEQARRDVADGGLRLVMLEIWHEIKKWTTVNKRHYALDLRRAIKNFIETRRTALIVDQLSFHVQMNHEIDMILKHLSRYELNISEALRKRTEDAEIRGNGSQMMFDLIKQTPTKS